MLLLQRKRPRLGPLRALNLNWQFKREIESVRTKEVQWVKNRIASPILDGSFSVILGPRRIGKSVAVNWAANGLRGIIKTSPISPGSTQDVILDHVCKKITGLKGSFYDNEDSMKRVIKWYSRFFGRVPVIIISATQRNINQEPAQLTGAARILVENFGLNVLIDCSENAFPDILTGRERTLSVEHMTR